MAKKSYFGVAGVSRNVKSWPFGAGGVSRNVKSGYFGVNGVSRQFLSSISSYLTFESPNPFTIAVENATKNWNGTLFYSTDASIWKEWDGTSAISSGVSNGTNAIYMAGTGNTKITGGKSKGWLLTGTDIRCNGNIETLLDYATVESGEHPTMDSNCYSYMFYDCDSLTQAPDLPATTLSGYCYANMFQYCSNLTKAPSLPATNLAYSCYNCMFQYCSSLTQVPALPATTLPTQCYFYMFANCINIKLANSKNVLYTKEYRIPTSGTGTASTNATSSMFDQTGGTFKGSPKINTTYYLYSTNVIV